MFVFTYSIFKLHFIDAILLELPELTCVHVHFMSMIKNSSCNELLGGLIDIREIKSSLKYRHIFYLSLLLLLFCSS